MFRPVTITHPVVVNDGKPFEAFTTTLQFDCQNCGTVSILYYRDGVQIEEPLIEGIDTVAGDLFVNLIKYQLFKALNPPIEVTKKVLGAMEKVPEAKFRVLEAGLLPQLFTKRVGCKTKKEGGTEWIYGKTYYYESWVDGVEKELRIGDYIQADCPLALQVLLGFTTEGVPVNE